MPVLLTILTAVVLKTAFGLPPVVGMMMGLGYLQFLVTFYSHSARLACQKTTRWQSVKEIKSLSRLGNVVPFDVFSRVSRAEWDTLLFFYGIVICVGGLGFIGYLALLSDLLYTNWSATGANIILGLMSAVVDNIPVMFAVLQMMPEMSHGQWLLITLTAGIGGSLLSIGSAAGVALMGQARGIYI